MARRTVEEDGVSVGKIEPKLKIIRNSGLLIFS